MEVKVTKIARGSIFTMDDHNPTGSILSHNYVVLSIGNENIPCSKVICMGVTSCRNASEDNCFHDMMPIVMTNGYLCFIDTTKVYTFRPYEINLNRFKGVIDSDITEKLLKVYLIRIGLGSSEEYSMLREELGLKDISTPQKNKSLLTSVDEEDTVSVTSSSSTEESSKISSSDEDEKEVKKEESKKDEIVPWYPRLISEYTDEQLERALVILRSGDAEWCAREMHCNSYSAIRQKLKRILEEIDLRTPQKFSEKFQKFGSKPEFWEKSDLERFSKLFTSDREQLEVESGQKSSQLFKIFDTVKKELKRREIG